MLLDGGADDGGATGSVRAEPWLPPRNGTAELLIVRAMCDGIVLLQWGNHGGPTWLEATVLSFPARPSLEGSRLTAPLLLRQGRRYRMELSDTLDPSDGIMEANGMMGDDAPPP